MNVYLTKKMLSKLNNVAYPVINTVAEDSMSDHWQKLFDDRTIGPQLSKQMICRVCGKNGCTPLTEKISDNNDIMGAICSVSNVAISSDDSLPKYICTECLESLKVALTFKRNCEVADRRFKKILNPMGDPLLHSYPYSKHDFQLILHHFKKKRLKHEEAKELARKKKEKLQQKKQQPKKKEIKCSSCDMAFTSKDGLTAHRQEKQCMLRACDICGQLVYSIAKHMRHIHKQVVSHKCPTCGKEFPIIARLKNHMLVHTDTFNFFCDLCPYKCKHKYYLVMHMRTHTGEKPYKCLMCPATFVNPSNLNKHKLTHQEKQFKCMMCEKAFRTNAALREHHDATHRNIKHTCNFCGRDFCYKSDLRKHEIRTHNRIKRDYVGGEPTYKQVERMQKDTDTLDKWRHQEMIQPQVEATYIEQKQEYIHGQQMLYFTDVSGIIQPGMLQQQTVQQTFFTSMCKGGNRTISQLKSQWGLIKMVKKKENASARKLLLQTGGGPPAAIIPKNADDISSWLPNEFTIDCNEFDSDHVNQFNKIESDVSKKNEDPSDEIILYQITNDKNNNPDMANVISEGQTSDFIKNQSACEETPVPTTLSSKLKKPVKKKESVNKVTNISTFQKDIAETEMACRKELHEIQMENERKRSRNLDLEAEILLKKLHE